MGRKESFSKENYTFLQKTSFSYIMDICRGPVVIVVFLDKLFLEITLHHNKLVNLDPPICSLKGDFAVLNVVLRYNKKISIYVFLNFCE